MPPVAGGGEDVRLMAHGDVENPHFVKTNCAPLKTAYGDFSRRSICFSSSHRTRFAGLRREPCLPCQERTRLFIGVREKALHGARLAEVGNPCRANCGGADGEIRHRLCLRSFCCRNQEDEGAST
jgi:hypothetical protein